MYTDNHFLSPVRQEADNYSIQIYFNFNVFMACYIMPHQWYANTYDIIQKIYIYTLTGVIQESKGAMIFTRRGGLSVCGGDQNFLGGQRGSFFFTGSKGGQNFFAHSKGGNRKNWQSAITKSALRSSPLELIAPRK